MITYTKKEGKKELKKLDIHSKYEYIQGDYSHSVFCVGDLIGLIKYRDGCFYPFLNWLTKEQYEYYLKTGKLNIPRISLGIFEQVKK